MYKLIKATEMNIELIKDIKLETIFSSPDEFGEGNEDKIKEYVDVSVKEFLDDTKMVIINDSIAGIFLVRNFEDGVLIDELYLYGLSFVYILYFSFRFNFFYFYNFDTICSHFQVIISMYSKRTTPIR